MKKLIPGWKVSFSTLLLIITILACNKTEEPVPISNFMDVSIHRFEFKHDLYYRMSHDEQSVELEFSHELDPSSVEGNILLEDKNGDISEHMDVLVSGNRVLLVLHDDFQFRDGWKYLLKLQQGIRSVNGLGLPAQTVFQLRTLSNHKLIVPDALKEGRDTIQRNTIAIISDIHMGDARAVNQKYSWFYKNADALTNFLDYVKQGKQVRQLIILGDLFDEWMIPYSINPFDTSIGINSTKDYFKAIAGNPTNAPIISRLQDIALDPDIELIYVTGNHDMLNEQDILEEIIPGITWKGGPEGLGEYSPVDEMIFEHGHRYDFSNCPQPLVNPGHMLPPGYFISRMYAQGLMEKNNPSQKDLWEYQGDFEFLAAWEIAFLYTYLHFDMLPPDLSAKIIKMGGVDAYDEAMSFHGARDMFAANIEDNWDATQTQNQVPVHINCCLMAIWNGHSDMFGAAKKEYMESSSPKNYSLVAFGHTHEPMLEVYPSGKFYSSIYANSGSWLNSEESSHKVRTYLMIKPGKWTGSELDVVSLFQYNLESENGGSGYEPVLIAEENI